VTNKVVMNSTELEAFNQVIMRGVQDMTEMFRGLSDEHSPKGETGLMAGAHQTMYDRDDLTGYVMNDTEYAKYVHWGTKPYYIRIVPYNADPAVIKELGQRAVVINGVVMVPVFIGWVRKVLGLDEVSAYLKAWAIHRRVRTEGFTPNPWLIDAYYDFLQHDYIQRAFPDFKVVMA